MDSGERGMNSVADVLLYERNEEIMSNKKLIRLSDYGTGNGIDYAFLIYDYDVYNRDMRSFKVRIDKRKFIKIDTCSKDNVKVILMKSTFEMEEYQVDIMDDRVFIDSCLAKYEWHAKEEQSPCKSCTWIGCPYDESYLSENGNIQCFSSKYGYSDRDKNSYFKRCGGFIYTFEAVHLFTNGEIQIGNEVINYLIFPEEYSLLREQFFELYNTNSLVHNAKKLCNEIFHFMEDCICIRNTLPPSRTFVICTNNTKISIEYGVVTVESRLSDLGKIRYRVEGYNEEIRELINYCFDPMNEENIMAIKKRCVTNCLLGEF